jgi:hypothetical protein
VADNLQLEIHWCNHLFNDLTTSFATETDPSLQPIPEQNPEKLYNDLVPSCIIVPSHINKHLVQNALLTLMDLGSSFTLIHCSKLPPGCIPERLQNVQELQTADGNFHFSQHACLTNSHFPEFSCALHIKSMATYIFDTPCKYDMIIGCNWMVPNKFDISFSTAMMNWFNHSVPMKPATMSEMFFLGNHDDLTDDPLSDLFMMQSSEILPAKYEEVLLDKVVTMQDHLLLEQKTKLCST